MNFLLNTYFQIANLLVGSPRPKKVIVFELTNFVLIIVIFLHATFTAISNEFGKNFVELLFFQFIVFIILTFYLCVVVWFFRKKSKMFYFIYCILSLIGMARNIYDYIEYPKNGPTALIIAVAVPLTIVSLYLMLTREFRIWIFNKS
jgi:hypothetical protein